MLNHDSKDRDAIETGRHSAPENLPDLYHLHLSSLVASPTLGGQPYRGSDREGKQGGEGIIMNVEPTSKLARVWTPQRQV